MVDKKNSKNLGTENIYMMIVGIILFINMITPYIYPIKPAFAILIDLGWIILISGLILVVFSMITLSKRGIENLTEKGVYSIVRHPLYVGSMIMFLSHMFFFQHWFFILNSCIAIWVVYRIILLEEKELLKNIPRYMKNILKKFPVLISF